MMEKNNVQKSRGIRISTQIWSPHDDKMSRVYKIGNIFTRVDGLIRKNHVKEVDKPLWVDVYKRFPPKYDPQVKRKEPEMTLRSIFYKEDALRAKIHKEFENRLGVFNFLSKRESHSQRLLKLCQEYISQGMSEDEAIEKLKVNFKSKTEKASQVVTEEKNEGAIEEALN